MNLGPVEIIVTLGAVIPYIIGIIYLNILVKAAWRTMRALERMAATMEETAKNGKQGSGGLRRDYCWSRV